MKLKSQQILKDNDLSVTIPRTSIIEMFSKGCSPQSAEHIAKKLSKKKIDLATVYRTLSAFEKKGIVRKVDLRKDVAFYELADSHHHHLVCRSCDKVEEFSICSIDNLLQRALSESSHFKSIDHHALELFGTCASCAKK